MILQEVLRLVAWRLTKRDWNSSATIRPGYPGFWLAIQADSARYW